MSKRNIEAVYPLSPMQQGMLFHSLYAPEAGDYFEISQCTLHGELDLRAFEQAWQALVDRHAVLRSAFVWKRTERMLQVVHKQVELPLHVQDWRPGQAAAGAQDEPGLPLVERLHRFIQHARLEGFDLSRAPLLRIYLFRTADETHELVWFHHHALLDGWSLPLLMRELLVAYDTLRQGRPLQLPAARPYREYIAWLQTQDLGRAENYWKETLAGFHTPTPLASILDELSHIYPDPVIAESEATAGEAGQIGVGSQPHKLRPAGPERVEVDRNLSRAHTAALQGLGRSCQVTVSTLLQAAWGLLLGRLTGEPDVAFGVTLSGRPASLPGVETMVGLFINTLPLRLEIQPDQPLDEWLKEVQRRMVQIQEVEYSPLFQVQTWSALAPGTSLFDSILIFENYPVDAALQQARLAAGEASRARGAIRMENFRAFEQTNYPLTLVSGPGEQLPLRISFNPDQFSTAAVTKLLGLLQTLLEQMANAVLENDTAGLPSLRQLANLNPQEYQHLVVDQNLAHWPQPDAGASAIERRPVTLLFEETVLRQPHEPALRFVPGTAGIVPVELTFEQLNRRANRLARGLRQMGLRAGDIAAISLERSPEMLVAVLGVMKAGAAYLPLDATYPFERLQTMLQDAQPAILITSPALDPREPGTAPKLAPELPRLWMGLSAAAPAVADPMLRLEQDFAAFAEDNLPDHPQPGDLAYMIFTSGSTGRPKGVLIEHASLTNAVLGHIPNFGTRRGSRFLQFASFSFDAAVTEFFQCLTAGAVIVLSDQQTLSAADSLLEFLRKEEINQVVLPPSLLRVLPPDDLPHLQHLVSAGEALPVDVARRWAVGRSMVNGYGPTETTVGPTCYRIPLSKQGELLLPAGVVTVPIGQLIPNMVAVVVDFTGQPLPPGISGELWIGGVGVARGYHKRPELTEQKFIPNPFPELAACAPRLYRTGDLARWLPDAGSGSAGMQLEFTGRVDQQVKIRGYRIELGEIEAVLAAHPQIATAAVLVERTGAGSTLPGERQTGRGAYPGGSQRLVACIVPAQAAPGSQAPASAPVLEPGEMRAWLAQYLPDYMLPASYFLIESLPLTPNGKVDRKALALYASSAQSVNAQSPQQALPNIAAGQVVDLLASVWKSVLGVRQVNLEDDFFALGGHSLLATQLASRVRESFGVDLPLREYFTHANLRQMAERVEQELRQHQGADTPASEPLAGPPPLSAAAPGEEHRLLSFGQQRLWFLDQLAPGNLFYNIPLAVRLSGPLDVAALEQSLLELLRRHAVLRTTYVVPETQTSASAAPPTSADGEPRQQPIALEDIPRGAALLPFEDFSHLSPEEARLSSEQALQAEASRPFDLARGPVFRAKLLRVRPARQDDVPASASGSDEEHLLVITMHHIATDGWSMGILVQELAALYNAALSAAEAQSGQPEEPADLSTLAGLPALPVQYADFAHWQRNWLQGRTLEQQLDYWKQALAGIPGQLELPTDYPRPPVQSYRGAVHHFKLPPEVLEQLNQLSRDQGTTLFMTLLAAYQVLLYRYSGQEDVCVGVATANRNRRELEGLIGFFVNTLVLRGDLHGAPAFKAFLKRVRETALGAFMHQDLPFEALVDALQPERSLSHSPLFQVAFSLQNVPLSQSAVEIQGAASGLSFEPLSVDSGTAKFDLTLAATESETGLHCALEYNTDLFAESTIQRMAGHFEKLLQAILHNPDQSVNQLDLIPAAEREQLLVAWNNTQVQSPVDQCVHQLFEAQALRQPDHPALIFHDPAAAQSAILTYADLDQRANQLARALQKLGVGPETLVGVYAERSFEMVVGVLAALKAGGAYLPLDPRYPEDRIRFMLADSGVKVVLTQAHLSPQLSAFQLPMLAELDQMDWQGAGAVGGAGVVLRLDADWALIAQELSSKPACAARPENLAYVIYTSGSTGRPKGTLLEHRGLSNLTRAQQRAFGITSASRVLQFSPLSFDASVWETFMALANGATLCLGTQDALASGPELLRLLQKEEISNVTLPPSVLRMMMEVAPSPASQLPALRTIIAAGEACSAELVAHWAPGRDFFNAYGPTETTVCATMQRCDPTLKSPPPIGRPIANTRVYVLDRHETGSTLQLAPLGVPGELVVSGVSLARGYWNRPEIQSEKFLPNPFAPLGGEVHPGVPAAESYQRLYRTGDLVRYRPDGTLEFMGRVDQQVKLRGFRIELGEIEAALTRHPAVREAVVVLADATAAASGGGRSAAAAQDGFLAAYVVLHDPQALPDGAQLAAAEQEFSQEMRQFLRQSLPEYMIPLVVMALEHIPLSPSGKVDRKALPAPSGIALSGRKYLAPRNETEQILVELCAQLLRVEQVGVEDSFFELGGHSLLGTQLISRIRERFGVDVPLRSLFETPTVAGLAAFIQSVLEEERAQKAANEAKLAQLLQQLNALSDEDVKRMLDEKQSG